VHRGAGAFVSGGSYDYIERRTVDELMSDGRAHSSLEQMADDLAALGYARDAAAETMQLILDIRAFANRIEAHLDRLRPVWHAMEWWWSCDSSENDFKIALKWYRGEFEPHELIESDYFREHPRSN